ncbi:MAG: NAD-dependent epimerase/dehydratase family protein [bacterium]|nr:NAD-dependent epimerase/dehydratase family protein [bacterium]MCP5065077.1 NAD-dependent epimerase/dehydratase family protein [bacterium]
MGKAAFNREHTGMRVMLTGATGLVGFHAAVALAQAGHETRCLVRSADKLQRAFAKAPVPTPDHVVGDMTDPGAVSAAFEGCDGALHAAGHVSIQEKHAGEMMTTNTRGTELVIGGAVERGLRHIAYVSSLGAIFDPWGGEPRPDGPVIDSDNGYSRSKAACEAYVRRLQKEGAPIAIVYPGAIHGPDDPGLSEANRALTIFVRHFILASAGGYMGIDARDLADALVRMLAAGRELRAVTAGHFLRWPELGDLLTSITGRPVRRIPGPGWMFRGLGVVGDIARRMVPFEFPVTRESMTFATRIRPVENSKELEELGVSWRPARETYSDSLRWLIAEGHLDHNLAPGLIGASVDAPGSQR